MPVFHLKTPVAFLIFNRPDTTERVFAEIARAKPPKLLVVADGARLNRPGEEEKVVATRAILERIDWDCEILTNFSDVNLGCKRRMSSGIDWVFEQVEEAIILEDDCLPDPTFFRFCEELLDRYRHDQRIGMISGDNFQFGRRRNDDSYYFSKYVHIWGWATWRDRWINSYDVSLSKWPDIRDGGWLTDLLGNANEAPYWENIFELVYRGEIDTWDYQWVFANWLGSRMSIMPTVNLISNIGFAREDATHTTGGSAQADLPRRPVNFPLTHPIGMLKDVQADLYSGAFCFRVSLQTRIHNKIVSVLRTMGFHAET